MKKQTMASFLEQRLNSFKKLVENCPLVLSTHDVWKAQAYYDAVVRDARFVFSSVGYSPIPTNIAESSSAILESFFTTIAQLHSRATSTAVGPHSSSCNNMPCNGRCEIITDLLCITLSALTCDLFECLIRGWTVHFSIQPNSTSSHPVERNFLTYLELVRQCGCLFRGNNVCKFLRAADFSEIVKHLDPPSIMSGYGVTFDKYFVQELSLYVERVQDVALTEDNSFSWRVLFMLANSLEQPMGLESLSNRELIGHTLERLLDRYEIENVRINQWCQRESLASGLQSNTPWQQQQQQQRLRDEYVQNVSRPLHVIAGMLSIMPIQRRVYSVDDSILRNRLHRATIGIVARCDSVHCVTLINKCWLYSNVVDMMDVQTCLGYIETITREPCCGDDDDGANLTKRELLVKCVINIVDSLMRRGPFVIPVQFQLARYMCAAIGRRHAILVSDVGWINGSWITHEDMVIRHLEEIELNRKTMGGRYRPFRVSPRLGNYICSAPASVATFNLARLILTSGVHENEWRMVSPAVEHEFVDSRHLGSLTPALEGKCFLEVVSTSPELASHNKWLQRIRLVTFLCYAMQTRDRRNGAPFMDRMLLCELFSTYV